MQPPPEPPKRPSKPSLRRYTWVRLHHDLLDNRLWALIARDARASIETVEAVVVRLEVFASTNTPRGSVLGFDPQALAAAWGRPLGDDTIERIYAALEDRHWIEQDCVQTFWERNPDQEDPTAAERQRRRRQRLKQERELARQQRREAAAEPVTRDSVTSRRDTVTVTTRSEQSINPDAAEKIQPVQSSSSDVASPELRAMLTDKKGQGKLPLPPVRIKARG